jgi:DNA-binding beta-propeller fold protein YncE
MREFEIYEPPKREPAEPPAIEPDVAPADLSPAGNHRSLKWLLSAKLTNKETFTAIAVALGIVLLLLIAYLLFLLTRGSSVITRGGAVKAGIQPLFVISGPGFGPNPRFSRPMGAAFGPDGRIYVSDTGNNRVCVFDGNGKFLFEWGGFGIAKPLPGAKYTWEPGKLNYPVGIHVDQDGTVYVADFRNDQVQVFTAEGRFIRAFPDNRKPTGKGSSGQDGGGIAVTDVASWDRKVYATDTYQVFVFDREGKLLRQFGKPGVGPTDLDHPNGVATDREGNVFVSDSNHARVIAFDPDFKRLWTVGQIPAGMNDTTSSPVTLPRGLAADDDGTVYVVDAFSFDIVEISRAGKIVARYGERGVAPGQVNFANDIDVRGVLVVLADKENNRVQVARLVHK